MRQNYAIYLWNRSYYNNLKVLCSPGDKVRIVFYKEVPPIEAELREKLGILETIIAPKVLSSELLPKAPRISKEQKTQARHSSQTKKGIQVMKGLSFD